MSRFPDKFIFLLSGTLKNFSVFLQALMALLNMNKFYFPWNFFNLEKWQAVPVKFPEPGRG